MKYTKSVMKSKYEISAKSSREEKGEGPKSDRYKINHRSGQEKADIDVLYISSHRSIFYTGTSARVALVASPSIMLFYNLEIA